MLVLLSGVLTIIIATQLAKQERREIQAEATEVIEVRQIEIKEKKEVPEILKKIAFCESGGRQFDENGNVLRGKINSWDVGKYQINLAYHQKRAEGLGFDLFTEAGNEGYALWLYEQEGTRPWNWSRSCWEK